MAVAPTAALAAVQLEVHQSRIGRVEDGALVAETGSAEELQGDAHADEHDGKADDDGYHVLLRYAVRLGVRAERPDRLQLQVG